MIELKSVQCVWIREFKHIVLNKDDRNIQLLQFQGCSLTTTYFVMVKIIQHGHLNNIVGTIIDCKDTSLYSNLLFCTTCTRTL